MQPVALLVDQLRSEETACRVEAMKKISTIALALGQERTRTEFIPFIESINRNKLDWHVFIF